MYDFGFGWWRESSCVRPRSSIFPCVTVEYIHQYVNLWGYWLEFGFSASFHENEILGNIYLTPGGQIVLKGFISNPSPEQMWPRPACKLHSFHMVFLRFPCLHIYMKIRMGLCAWLGYAKASLLHMDLLYRRPHFEVRDIGLLVYFCDQGSYLILAQVKPKTSS